MYEIVWYSILFISGGILCIQDWRTYSVGLMPLFFFLTACLRQYCIYREYSLILFYILAFLSIFFKLLTGKNTLGLADYFVSVAISPFLNNQDVPNLLILVGIYGIFATILIKTVRKKSMIPFVSVLLISVLTLRLYKRF